VIKYRSIQLPANILIIVHRHRSVKQPGSTALQSDTELLQPFT